MFASVYKVCQKVTLRTVFSLLTGPTMQYEQVPLSVLLPQKSWSLRTRLEIRGSGPTYCQITLNIFTLVRVSKSKEWMFGSQYQDFCILNLDSSQVLGMSVSNFGFKYAGCSCELFLFFRGVWPWPQQITEHEFLEAHSDGLEYKISNALLHMSTRKFLRQILQRITVAGHKITSHHTGNRFLDSKD